MPKAALICGEPIRPRMAGIGVRYLEMARHLPDFGMESVLVSPGTDEQLSGVSAGEAEMRSFAPGKLQETISDCGVVVAQGQSASIAIRELPHLPVVVDLYDPWLIENLHYSELLGNGPFENDYESWKLQMSYGDFFICSSPEQRNFYLGFLTALRRVNPELFNKDCSLENLISVVPFGIPETLPVYRPYLPERSVGEKRILFGGIYDWFDPWPLLNALDSVNKPNWTLYFIKNPNPETTPQKEARKIEAWSKKKGWWQNRVRMIDWVPFDRRYDLLRDVDLLAAPHIRSIEDRLSLRTRYLEAMAAGCPVMGNEGGSISRLIKQHDAGWIIPADNTDLIIGALQESIENDQIRAKKVQAGKTAIQSFKWKEVLEPLAAFCANPSKDVSIRRYVQNHGCLLARNPFSARQVFARIKNIFGRY